MIRFEALLGAGRLSEAVALLEATLGLEADDYRDPARLAGWRSQFFAQSGEELETALSILLALISALAVVYRVQDGSRLLAAFLDLEPEALADPERVARAASETLPPDPTFRVAFAMAVPAGLVGIAGQTATGLRLLEEAVGLEKEDWTAPERCADRLRTGLDGVPLEVRTAWLTMLVATLLDQRRAEDALTLYAADLGWPASLADGPPELLARALRARLAEISSLGAGTYPRGLARALAASGETAHAAAVLELYAGLEDALYEHEEALAGHLRERLAGMSGVTGVSFMNELVGNLKEAGEGAKAALLLRVYVDEFALSAEQNFDEPALADFTGLFEHWLEFFGDEPGGRPFEICRRLVEQFRRGMGGAPELEDRQAFLRTQGVLRRRVLAVGHRRAAGESDGTRRRALFREVVVWDAELSQRLLLERFLLGERPALAADVPPRQGWPLPDHPRSLIAGDDSLRVEDVGFLGEAEGIPIAVSSDSGEDLAVPKALAQRAEESALAAALGRDALLLRAAFDLGGRLSWSLRTSDGERLEILDHGSGRETDLEILRWAVARHDFALELVHSRVTGPAGREFARQLPDLQHALELLSGILETEAAAPTEESRRLLDDFERRFLPSSRWAADVFADLMRHLDESMGEPLKRPQKSLTERLFPLLWRPLFASRPEDAEKYAGWAKSAAKRIEEVRALVLSIATSRESRGAALDAATRRFLDEVSEIWRLDRVALPSERDVVFLVDDLLYSVPLAFVSVGGRPLYRQARSVRTSLGLLMDVSFREREEAAGPSPGRLLALSHGRPDDPALSGMAMLHHGLARTGDELGFETWAAAADPPATAGALRAALDAHPGFDVAAICGHGHAVRAGVVLAAPDGDPEGALWQGTGCDLSGVAWLFLVSCSIGRVAQTGELDAEGFAVELALHGARSVAAFRWPIASREAAAFATEAVGRYLRSLHQGATGPLRARALNEARRAFLDEARPHDAPGASLHTLAACELYGLG